jgi:hypothetical protein
MIDHYRAMRALKPGAVDIDPMVPRSRRRLFAKKEMAARRDKKSKI